MTETTMNTLEVLMKARALLARPNGWCQGVLMHHETGAHCARGAIEAVQGTLDSYQGAKMPTEWFSFESPAILALRVQIANGMIAEYNDEFGRTQKEVVALFDRAIEAEWEKVQGASEPIVRELVA